MKKILLLALVLSTSFVFAQPNKLKTSPSSETTPVVLPIVRVKPGHYRFNDTTVGSTQNVLKGTFNENASVVVEELPPEVVINGKPASQLTPEETQKFLQNKIRRTKQDNLEVRLIYIAPGYPVTLVFFEPIESFTIGDTRLISGEHSSSKELRLKALVLPPGDTSVQVITKRDKRLIYHVFIADNLANADLIVCVDRTWGDLAFYWFKKITGITILLIFGAIAFYEFVIKRKKVKGV